MNRTLVKVLALVVAAAVLAVFWVQAERSRARLAAELPRLRASIALLERDAQEVARLRAVPAGAPTARAPLVSLATDAGGVPGARITVMDDRRVRFEGNDVAFSALLDWLRLAQASHAMRVESARIDALPAPGRVKAQLILARS